MKGIKAGELLGWVSNKVMRKIKYLMRRWENGKGQGSRSKYPRTLDHADSELLI